MLRSLLIFGVLLLVVMSWFAFKPAHRVVAAPTSVDPGPEPAGLKPNPVEDLRSEDVADGKRFLIRNLVAGPIEVDCTLQGSNNITSEPAMPRRLLVPAKSERVVTIVRVVDSDHPSAVSVSCTAVIGDPQADVALDAIYAVPLYPDVKFEITQGYNGSYSHHDLQSQYAIDFGVAEGTPVLAARAGVVMEVENEFRGHGTTIEKYGDRANYVRVLHADGSMALYAHLAPESAIVHPGDNVHTGSFLGKSGNTGFTTGPHLHFAVQRNTGMQLQSLPFTMPGVDPNPAQ